MPMNRFFRGVPRVVAASVGLAAGAAFAADPPPPGPVAAAPAAVAPPPAGPPGAHAPAPYAVADAGYEEFGGVGAAGRHPRTVKEITCLPATVVPPVGAYARMANDAMKANALAEYFVIYIEDWFGMTDELNPSGVRHLDGILRRLSLVAAPVKVEPVGVPFVDQRRRAALVNALVKCGVPAGEAAARVTIGGTRAEGIGGDAIEAIYQQVGTPAGVFGPGGVYGNVGVGPLAGPRLGGQFGYSTFGPAAGLFR